MWPHKSAQIDHGSRWVKLKFRCNGFLFRFLAETLYSSSNRKHIVWIEWSEWSRVVSKIKEKEIFL